ncbi:MAG: putative capsid protein [Yuhrihovirus faecadaptatum]|uniref:Capsid protein n=1 Tax=Leviviridae sp. TaxID=2027243 RepID=A0ABY3SSF5_9VIRU|nr:MAG: putative capsid protein [Leviviridae sp.]
MPQLQSISLTDRTPTTPANIVFVPRDIDAKGVGTAVNTSGVPIGEKRISVSMKKAGARYNGEVRLVLPVVVTETINGVSRPVIARTAYITVSASFDEKSTEQERNDAVGLMATALATNRVLVNDALVKLEGIY